MKRTPLLILCALLAVPAWSADVQQPEMSFSGDEVRVDNGLISRRWKMVNGLPVPQSLMVQGREWLKPDGKPGIVPPGGAPKPPLRIEWADVSLVPIMEGKVQEVKSAAFNEDSDRKTVRTREWHYSLYEKKTCPKINRELYDLIKDPGETKNLAYDPAYAAAVQQCEDLIAKRLGLAFPETTTPSRKKAKSLGEKKAK